MKKYLFLGSVFTVIVFALSACGTTTTVPGTSTVTPTEQPSAPDALKNAQPQKSADVQGTIKSVTGNEFTIETIDMTSNPLLQEMRSADFRTKMQAMSDTDRKALMTKIQEARTNAKKILVDVTIPVGVPVLIRTRGGGGFPGGPGGVRPGGGQSSAGIGSSLKAPTTNTTAGSSGKQGTIADIKVGAAISVWLADNTGDRKIASWVSVSLVSSGGNGGMFGGGGGNGGNGGGNNSGANRAGSTSGNRPTN